MPHIPFRNTLTEWNALRLLCRSLGLQRHSLGCNMLEQTLHEDSFCPCRQVQQTMRQQERRASAPMYRSYDTCSMCLHIMMTPARAELHGRPLIFDQQVLQGGARKRGSTRALQFHRSQPGH